MNQDRIRINNRPVHIHVSLRNPKLAGKTVLTTSVWDYVRLYYKKNKKHDSLFFWNQAEEFMRASLSLPYHSSPLPLYYSILNATKSLLSHAGVAYDNRHGCSGKRSPSVSSLTRLGSKTNNGNRILQALMVCLGDPTPPPNTTYTIKELFRSLPFIHRCFSLTFQSETELYVPLSQQGFFYTNNMAYRFEAKVQKGYSVHHNNKPGALSVIDNETIAYDPGRMWSGYANPYEINHLLSDHRTLRKHIIPIISNTNRWYLKKEINSAQEVKFSQLPAIYMAMHSLSELARYDPKGFDLYLNSKYNWLISEFIRMAPSQFIHNIASEITGDDFINPDAASLD